MNENDDDFGPAMSALNERQQRFVVHFVDTLGRNWAESARTAGYAENSGNLIHTRAYKLTHNRKVHAAITERVKEKFAMATPLALATILDHASNPQSRDNFKAALSVLSMGGLPQETKTTVAHTIDAEDLIAKAKRLAAALGLDPRKLIGKQADVIDITPEVEEITEWTAI